MYFYHCTRKARKNRGKCTIFQQNIFTKEYLHEKPTNTLNLWLMLLTEKKKYHFLEPGMPLCALCTHLDSLLFVESWAESESGSAILSGPGAVWLGNRSGVNPIQKACFVTFPGQWYTNEAVWKLHCIQIGFPEQYLMIGLEDGKWPLPNKRGATVPKLKWQTDAGTKIANPEIMD